MRKDHACSGVSNSSPQWAISSPTAQSTSDAWQPLARYSALILSETSSGVSSLAPRHCSSYFSGPFSPTLKFWWAVSMAACSLSAPSTRIVLVTVAWMVMS